VVLNDVLEENVALLVEEVQFHADYLAHKDVQRVSIGFLTVLDVLLVCKETNELNHLHSVFILVMMNESTKSISQMYLDSHQSVVALLTNFDFAISNLVVYS
jgi:hypothetical protein